MSLPGSPFTVNVTLPYPYAPNCEARGDALSNVTARTSQSFEVLFRDRLGYVSQAVELDIFVQPFYEHGGGTMIRLPWICETRTIPKRWTGSRAGPCQARGHRRRQEAALAPKEGRRLASRRSRSQLLRSEASSCMTRVMGAKKVTTNARGCSNIHDGPPRVAASPIVDEPSTCKLVPNPSSSEKDSKRTHR